MVHSLSAPEGFVGNAEAVCYINGKRFELPKGRGEATLLQFLRGGKVSLQLPQVFCETVQIHFDALFTIRRTFSNA